MKPTHLDLFSGIGGFALAAQWAGFETIGFSEIEPYACKILKQHWPNITNYGDVRTVPAIRCDLITGGFPCQPHSLAGKRRGSKDDRHLWPAMRDVIGRCKPTWVCGENVPGIVGVELNQVLSDLESLGYRVQPLIIPACAVDANHRRDRVWIVAFSDRFKQRQDSMQNGCGVVVGGEESTERIEGSGEASGCSRILANANQSRSQGRDGQELRECSDERAIGAGGAFVGNSDKSRTDTHSASSGSRRTTGEPSRWLPEPAVGRVAHGIPNRSHRLKGLGNAIVPQVAQVILKAIRAALT